MLSFFKSDLIQSALALLVKLGSGGANHLLFIIAAQTLGHTEFGSFIYLFSIIMIMGMLGSFGQEMFLIKQIPKALSQGMAQKALGAYFFSATVALISGLLMAVAFYSLFSYGLSSKLSQEISMATASFGALLCAIFSFSQASVGALRAQEKSLFAVATRDLSWRILVIVGVGTTYLYGQYHNQQTADQTAILRSSDLLMIMAFTLIPIVMLQVGVVYKKIKQQFQTLTPLFSLKPWFETSFGLTVVGFVSSADLYLYTIFLGMLLSPVEVGAFFAALKTVELLNLFFMAVSLIVSPKISLLISQKKTIALQQKCNSALLLQGVPAIGSAIILYALAPYFLGFFSPDFVQYTTLLRLLIVGMMVNALTGPTVLMMQVSGLHWRQLYYQGGSLLLSLLLLPIFVYYFGVIGAAISFIISKVLWNFLAIIAIRKHLGVDPSLLGLFNPQAGGIKTAIKTLLPLKSKQHILT